MFERSHGLPFYGSERPLKFPSNRTPKRSNHFYVDFESSKANPPPKAKRRGKRKKPKKKTATRGFGIRRVSVASEKPQQKTQAKHNNKLAGCKEAHRPRQKTTTNTPTNKQTSEQINKQASKQHGAFSIQSSGRFLEHHLPRKVAQRRALLEPRLRLRRCGGAEICNVDPMLTNPKRVGDPKMGVGDPSSGQIPHISPRIRHPLFIN